MQGWKHGDSREAGEDTIGEKQKQKLSHAKLGRPRFDVQCRILLRRSEVLGCRIRLDAVGFHRVQGSHWQMQAPLLQQLLENGYKKWSVTPDTTHSLLQLKKSLRWRELEQYDLEVRDRGTGGIWNEECDENHFGEHLKSLEKRQSQNILVFKSCWGRLGRK